MGRLYGCSSAGHEPRLLRASDPEARSDAASASCGASRVVDCSPARRSASRRPPSLLLLVARCSASFWAISIWPTSTVSERSARTDSSPSLNCAAFAELRGGVRGACGADRVSRVRRVSRPHRRAQRSPRNRRVTPAFKRPYLSRITMIMSRHGAAGARGGPASLLPLRRREALARTPRLGRRRRLFALAGLFAALGVAAAGFARPSATPSPWQRAQPSCPSTSGASGRDD